MKTILILMKIKWINPQQPYIAPKTEAETTLALVEAAKNIRNAVWGKNKFLRTFAPFALSRKSASA